MPEFDVAISEDLFQRLSHSTREQVCYYAYFDCEQSCYKLSSDDERFANHSDTPNTRSIGDQVYAARDIAAGEEITIDYREDGEYGFPQPGEYGFPWRGKGGDDGREELRNERRIPSS